MSGQTPVAMSWSTGADAVDGHALLAQDVLREARQPLGVFIGLHLTPLTPRASHGGRGLSHMTALRRPLVVNTDEGMS